MLGVMNEVRKSGYESLRTMAEEGDLEAAIRAWWGMVADHGNSIASILLLRAAAELGILPEGVDAGEVIRKCKFP